MITGEAIYTLAPISEPQTQVRLDAEDLTLDGAEAAGEKARRRMPRKTSSSSDLPRAYGAGESLEIRVKYHGRPRQGDLLPRPRRDQARPYRLDLDPGGGRGQPLLVPLLTTTPTDKLTSALSITLPAKFVAISNGKLLGTKTNADGTATWSWSEKVKHSSYLISIVAGDYEEVPPGVERHGRGRLGAARAAARGGALLRPHSPR
jgi:aminopeptidase N